MHGHLLVDGLAEEDEFILACDAREFCSQNEAPVSRFVPRVLRVRYVIFVVLESGPS